MALLRTLQRPFQHAPGLYRAIRAVWSPPPHIYRQLNFTGEFTLTIEPGATVRLFNHGDLIENDLFWGGYGNGWEGNCLKLWREMVRGADFIADVGANTGVFALAAQALRPQAKVLAVEPSSAVYTKLQRNIALNRFPIVAVACAASDKTGSAPFYEPSGQSYTASLEKAMNEAWATVAVTVPVARLDDVLARVGFSQLDAIKLDVEMHEPAALRGMRATLEKHRPTMLIEILNEALLREIDRAFAGLDYAFRQLRADGHGSERNYLVAVPDKMAELEAKAGQGTLA